MKDITIELGIRRDNADALRTQLRADLKRIQEELMDAEFEFKAAETLYVAEQRRWARVQPPLFDEHADGMFSGIGIREASLKVLAEIGAMNLKAIEATLVKGGFRFDTAHPGRAIHGALFGARGKAERDDKGVWSST